MNSSRITVSYVTVVTLLLIILARYTYLQLFSYNELSQKSISNYSSTVANLPVRGTILDRNNVVLANNVVSYAVGILPKDYSKSVDLISQLGKYVNITKLDIKKFKHQLKNVKNYNIVIIKDDLTNVEIANLTSHIYSIPKVMVFARIKRNYPFANIYSHAVGYVGKISTNDLSSHNIQGYLVNDYIGKSGLEKFYESSLRGVMGEKIIQTDAKGNEISLIKNTPGIDGNTIKLTIDNKLQNLASSLLQGKNGAIVAINPQTGGILAFVSQPGYNPNWFIDGINYEGWDELRGNPDKPLLDRVLQSSYPPGSTFKPFLGIAALYLGFRTPTYSMFDPGYFVIPGSTHKFRDNPIPYGLGTVAMEKAIVLSSDTYFYKLAYDMGIDNIDKGVSLFGLGRKTGIDLPDEESGLLPSKRWKERKFKNSLYQHNWLPADSITVGIGQGFNHYTPLQMAYATTIIANEGTVIKPHFLDTIINHKGEVIYSWKNESYTLPIKKANFDFMKKAMQMVVTNGTARQIGYGLEYTMAGKTGTAQVVSTIKNGRQQKFAGKKYKDHSWFIAFAPTKDPKIAISILVENGGFGTQSAAPIARKLFDFYLLGKS